MNRNLKKILLSIIFIISLVGFIISGYKIYTIYELYKNVDDEIEQLQKFSPIEDSKQDIRKEYPSFVSNKFILDLKKKNEDTVGWLKIKGTRIDYPFVLGKDNDEYLRRSFYDNSYLASGTIFLDYRCNDSFSDFNNIVYGHKMRNGTMFGELDKFKDIKYFDSHNIGKLYLEDVTYSIHTYAYLVVRSDDKIVFDNKIEKNEFLKYIKDNAINYKNLDIGEYDTLLTLSTCNYDFEEARSILILNIKKV